MPYTVLLYYQFAAIEDPQALADWQRSLCEELSLKGRILVGSEGLNGTVAGSREMTERYKQAMWQHPVFKEMSFKESLAEEIPFPKLKIKVRPEIISLHDETIRLEEKAAYITPEALHSLYESGEEFYVLDARNAYESEEGTFEGAITPDITNFRELPLVLENYANLKDKKVVTCCTGGIRCEKASALLRQHGFKDVYQLEGGIVSYIHAFPNQRFQGDCFVFDDRLRLTQDEIAKNGAISQAPQYQGQR